METPRKKQRNAASATPWICPKRLFHAMACDLKIQNENDVIDAYSLLCAERYASLVKVLDDWTSQMYTSIGDSIHRRHQLAALFLKYPFDDKSIDRDKIAIDKFLKSERRCARMNVKFRARRSRAEPPHMQFMRNWLGELMGAEPPLKAIYAKCDFGPGSSVGTHGSDVSVLNKLDCLTVTPAARQYALASLCHNRHYMQYLVEGEVGFGPRPGDEVPDLSMVEVLHNKIVCVPKNAKTNRTIAIEPAMNGFLQKGVDMKLRSFLKRTGVDLSSQALNQALARLGSRDRSYSTIDLSAASDSISIELVRELLPPAWFALLNCLRSPMYMLPDGSMHRYHKFCSMGNGFCFPLETLIFRAACEYAMSVTQISVKQTCSVYGDDIIVPRECALVLLETLSDLGFRANVEKTFILGSFKESCGADYFDGVDVRDVYVKKPLRADHNAYPLLNELRRRNLLCTWKAVFEQLPMRWRNLRPYDRDDDSALTVPIDTFMASSKARWNRFTHSWNWLGVFVASTPGRKPRGDLEILLGKLRGDLTASDTFTARFGERTRLAWTC